MCPDVNVCSLDASVYDAYWCVGAGRSIEVDRTQPRPDGHWWCMLCLKHIKSNQPDRPHGNGRAHDTCVRRAGRADASPRTSIPRTKRPYDSLQPTQQWKRRKQAHEAVTQVLDEIGVPLEVIQAPPTPSPADVLHLSTAERDRVRTIPGVHIPCERTIIKCKKKLPLTHATGTSTFANGAYITDPIRFVTGLCLQSSLIAVGGDAGNGSTKLSITYVQGNQQKFATLLVYQGSDKYDDLGALRQSNLTPFDGDSAAFSNIFDVLQHIIDQMEAFLNGGWPFINTVLGLKNASATHPCPICTISFSNLLGSAQYRKRLSSHSRNRDHDRLLTIDPERIVPTPLHLFLGLGNRVILDAFSELLGKELVEEALKPVTTIHSAGSGGKSDIFQLNGPEIRKWIKYGCSTTLRESAEKVNELDISQKASHGVLSRWLQNLHDHLLHKGDWDPKEIEDWRAAVTDIQQNWSSETGQAAFPKLHMLKHTLEFAERHRFLGRASEAQIESYHYQFKVLFNHNHRNMSQRRA